MKDILHVCKDLICCIILKIDVEKAVCLGRLEQLRNLARILPHQRSEINRLKWSNLDGSAINNRGSFVAHNRQI